MRRFLAATISGVVAGATLVLALVVAGAIHAPVTIVYATLLVTAWLAVRGPSERALGAHGPFAAAGVLILLVPLVWLGARMAIAEPLVVSSYGRCGTGMAMAVIAAPFVVGAVAFVGFLVGDWIAPAVGAPGPRLRRFAVGLGTGVVLAATVMVGLATIRTRGRPAPDAWIQGLPVVARLADLPFRPYVDPSPPPPHGAPFTEQALLPDGAVLLRGCEAHSCRVALLGAPRAPEGRPSEAIGVGPETWVRRLPNGYVFLTPTWVEGALTRDGRRLDVHVLDVAPLLSAPRGWLSGAAIATVLAALAIVRARRLRVATDDLLDGVVVEGGVELEDRSAWTGALPAAFPVGAAVLARAPGAQTFRDVPEPVLTLGSKAALESAAHREAVLLATFAVVTVLLGLAPLAAAAWSRLVV